MFSLDMLLKAVWSILTWLVSARKEFWVIHLYRERGTFPIPIFYILKCWATQRCPQNSVSNVLLTSQKSFKLCGRSWNPSTDRQERSVHLWTAMSAKLRSMFGVSVGGLLLPIFQLNDASMGAYAWGEWPRIIKYARTVKQKVWSEAENSSRALCSWDSRAILMLR